MQNHALDRRRLLGLGACGAAAVALSPFGTGVSTAAPAAAAAAGGRLIPPAKVGTITYTQRDVPNRLGIATGSPTMGYLGGASFPENPSDLGPLVPLPGGWKELFEYFAAVGINQVEFAGYGQNPANPGGTASYVATPEGRANYLAYAQRLRGLLDDNGLEAIGNHGFIPGTWYGPNSAGGTMSQADYDRFQTELEFGAILGTPFLGTGSDPTNANNRNIEPWTVAGEKWEAINLLSRQWGIQMYPHNHAEAYHFLADGPMVTVTQDRVTGAAIAPTLQRAESGKRLMQHYLDVTSPDLVVVEMDVYWAHVAQHRFRWRYDENGQRVQDIFDPLATVAQQTKRYPLYHAKDGDRTADPVGVGTGYTMVPFGDPTSDIDYETFLSQQGAKGFHNPNYEQDNAPGGPTDPGRSLRYTAISAANMSGLRG
jgi:sugar phosphate isomerase/epimerase